jgi:formiminoglutamase
MPANDVRIGEIIGRFADTKSRESISLIGFPSDEGVRVNGGRVGAAKAPEQIFNRLMKLTPHPVHAEKQMQLIRNTSKPYIQSCTGRLEEDQLQLGVTVSGRLKNGILPVIAGGGHETAFGHFSGYSKIDQPVHILNIDAHTDVRPLKVGLPHSGSPFRQAVEDPSGCCKSYSVFGLQPSSVAAEHLAFVNEHGCACMAEELTLQTVEDYFENLEKESSSESEQVMLTMDMDAVDQSQAPGVSAPNPAGISSRVWLEIAFYCGKQPQVSSFDVCEVNPDFDRDQQTVRLAALTIWYFLLGVSLR